MKSPWFKKFSANRKWAARLAGSRSGFNHRCFDKYLRAHPTVAESRVMRYLKALDVQFAFQKRNEAFVVDFQLKRSKTILEIDGKIHEQRKEYDAERDKWFKYRGWRVVRIKNEQTETLEKFVESIPLEWIREHVAGKKNKYAATSRRPSSGLGGPRLLDVRAGKVAANQKADI